MNEFLNSIFSRLQSYFNAEEFGGVLAEFLGNVIVAILVFLVYYLLWRLTKRIAGVVMHRAQVDETASRFIETILKYVILTIGAVSALSAIGINTASVLTSLGIAGLTIGFAARDALSNIISGIFIFWDRPFVIGDLIEVDGKYGRVEEITLRSTRVVTVDGKMLAIPNTTMVNTTVASYTNFPNLRLDLEVTIAVTEDIDRARQALLNLVGSNPDYLDEPAPRVVVTQLNDYNVALELQAWLKDERQHIPQRFALREAIYKALTEAGVDMPFETLQLTPLEFKNSGDGAPVEIQPPSS